MLTLVKSSFATKLQAAAEVVAIGFSLSGAVAAFVFAKFLLAVVLGAIALGVTLRFVTRRKAEPNIARTPVWARLSAALLATVETGVLVEATDLPVRFSQPGFQFHHWLFVLLVWFVAYLVQLAALRPAHPRVMPPKRSNPSIERTSPGKPGAASHVKR